MRFIASFCVGVFALCAGSSSQAADLLGASVTASNFRGTTTHLGITKPVPPLGSEDIFGWWRGVHTYHNANETFGDNDLFHMQANWLLAAEGPTYSNSSQQGQAQVHDEPGSVTLKQVMPASESLKQTLARPDDTTLWGWNGARQQSLNTELTFWLFGSSSGMVFWLDGNTTLDVAIDITLNNLADPSQFFTDSTLAPALGQTVTGVSGSTSAGFSMSFEGGQAGSSASLSSFSSYVIDHEGKVTTSGNNGQVTQTLYASFRNNSASAMPVYLDVTLLTSAELRTTFDPTLVGAVPEPGSVVLALAGMGLLGVFARRRQAA